MTQAIKNIQCVGIPRIGFPAQAPINYRRSRSGDPEQHKRVAQWGGTAYLQTGLEAMIYGSTIYGTVHVD